MGNKTALQIGDRVVCTSSCWDDDELQVGELGTIITLDYYTDDTNVGVRWDEFRAYRHTCDGHCEDGHGWYVSPTNFEMLGYDSDDEIEFTAIDNII